MLYSCLLEEAWIRGTYYIKKAFDRSSEPSHCPMIFQVYFNSFHSIIVNTTWTKVIGLLRLKESVIETVGERQLFIRMLNKLQKSSTPIHSLKAARPMVNSYKEEMKDLYEGSLSLSIKTSNMDSGRIVNNMVYKDMTLGWLLKMIAAKRDYRNWEKGQVSVGPSYFRVVHQGKTIFLSSAGKKTLHKLGMKDGDEIVFGGVESKPASADETVEKERKKDKKPKKKSGAKKKKKKKSEPPPSLTEEQIMEKYRQEHSRTMTPVFEELGPLLKDIRNCLNNLTLKKSAPKVRRHKYSKKRSDPKARINEFTHRGHTWREGRQN